MILGKHKLVDEWLGHKVCCRHNHHVQAPAPKPTPTPTPPPTPPHVPTPCEELITDPGAIVVDPDPVPVVDIVVTDPGVVDVPDAVVPVVTEGAVPAVEGAEIADEAMAAWMAMFGL